MFSSLRARLWLSYALLIVAALGVVALALGIYLLRNPFLHRETMERLRMVQSLVVRRPLGLFDGNQATGLQRVADEFDARILLYDANGEVLRDTQPGRSPIAQPKQPLVPRTVPTTRDANGQVWLYSLHRYESGQVLLVATPRPRVPVLNILRDDLLPMLLQGGGIALLLSLVLAYAVARWVADPLQRIILASQRFPSAAAQPIAERGPREVRELTRAFNAMTTRVQSAQKSQRDFVANVSHELKTPLTSVQGFAQALLDGTADTQESRKQAAEVIYHESGRMYRMVLDLLDLARLDAGTAELDMQPVDVAALLNGIAEKFSLLAQKAGISLQVDAPSDLPALVGDGDRLAQVFTNLVDNALAYTSSGGRVTLQAAQAGHDMEFIVSDTGRGIPAEALAHVFERFYQADPSRTGGEKHGAGLGLAIAREIITAHGGRITVRSQEGQGTTFTIRLPLSQDMVTTVVRRKK